MVCPVLTLCAVLNYGNHCAYVEFIGCVTFANVRLSAGYMWLNQTLTSGAMQGLLGR